MKKYFSLLDKLISTPSFSREECATATIIESFLKDLGIKRIDRDKNNIWVKNSHFDLSKPTLLLNSHHDTVRPVSSYSRDPFLPSHENGRIYGLGSNDAGGAVISLIATFETLYQEVLPFNIILAITAEEEITGLNGISHLLPILPQIDMGIVGEPTNMNVALGEKGLVVLDCIAKGETGHAANYQGDNSIYIALDDIEFLKNYKFEKESSLLGPIKITTTQINAGTQHNVIPSECSFVVDVRTTDAYSNEDTVKILQSNLRSSVTPRSLRINASSIEDTHSLVVAAKRLKLPTFISPTCSDMSQMNFPTIKMGPGDSLRSHKADEWIGEEEIIRGIKIYIDFIKNLEI